MKKELDLALCKDFPFLYKDRYADRRSTAMCWGFDCGDGWEPIIREASANIEAIIHREGWHGQIYATQVKEKMAGLCLYMSGYTDEIDAIIDEAQEKARKTCEECGLPGICRKGSWLQTLCDEHAKGREPIGD